MEEKRKKLLQLAIKHGFTRAPVQTWQMWCEEDELIALLEDVERSALERAAELCKQSSAIP